MLPMCRRLSFFKFNQKNFLAILLFVTYVALSSSQYVIVRASQTDQKYTYNTVTVVMMTESAKLIISLLIFLKDNSITEFVRDFCANWKILLLYIVPSVLYCISNNLVFLNLEFFDPTTYNVLQQFRIALVGILYQIFFKRCLSIKQWASLCLLTVGCVIKPIGDQGGALKGIEQLASLHGLLVFAQILSTALSGVFNEVLIKDSGAELHLMLHNVFMYFDSILCNLIVLAIKGDLGGVFKLSELETIFGEPLVCAVIASSALCGLMVPLFLKYFNSIAKTFTSSLELITMAVLCWIVFDIPIDQWTVLAILIVSLATYTYFKNPVINKPVQFKKSIEDPPVFTITTKL